MGTENPTPEARKKEAGALHGFEGLDGLDGLVGFGECQVCKPTRDATLGSHSVQPASLREPIVALLLFMSSFSSRVVSVCVLDLVGA